MEGKDFLENALAEYYAQVVLYMSKTHENWPCIKHCRMLCNIQCLCRWPLSEQLERISPLFNLTIDTESFENEMEEAEKAGRFTREEYDDFYKTTYQNGLSPIILNRMIEMIREGKVEYKDLSVYKHFY